MPDNNDEFDILDGLDDNHECCRREHGRHFLRLLLENAFLKGRIKGANEEAHRIAKVLRANCCHCCCEDEEHHHHHHHHDGREEDRGGDRRGLDEGRGR